jgi:RND family efflux transporter MFP subunit
MNKKANVTIRLKWIIVIASLTLVYSCQTKEDQNKSENNNSIAPVKVAVQKVTTGTSSNKLTYNGNVVPETTIPLSFILPGTVISVKAEEGDWVKKGQILAELNNTSYKNAYQGTLATQKQAQDAYDRLKTVHDKGSLTEIRWEDVKTKLEQAKSANQIALQSLSNTTLKAPSDGYIGMRNIEIGETAIPGDAIFNLVSINEVYVKLSVPENEINKINKEQDASIVIPALGSEIFTGKVEKIGVVANPISKTYEVKIKIANQQMKIKPGMACDIEINISATNDVIAVPYQCVLKGDNGQNYVYIVDSQTKTASKKAVKLGSFINNEIEIVSGISIGDLIVTEGKQKLSDQAKVIF